MGSDFQRDLRIQTEIRQLIAGALLSRGTSRRELFFGGRKERLDALHERFSAQDMLDPGQIGLHLRVGKAKTR